ncbi:MAG: leucine-rich repeat domain-containing protein [Candidatus Aminicenantes bacterium]|nr:leucine-rich repeat domain-containing protein [Candidatus Aminicenantes bacterium]
MKTAWITRRRRAGSVFLFLTTVVSLVFLALPELAQAQTLPVTPVCDRTPEVRDAIVEKVPDVDDCGNVTEAHLAEIDGVLDLQGPYTYWGVTTGLPNPIPELKAGDFSGLSTLEGLRLHYNDLTTLPPGLFHGLSSVITLSLENNHLTTLPAGIFAGLSSLRTLAMSENPLTTLPPGIFSGLTVLDKLTLSLHYNELTPPHGGIFSGLTVLNTLRLSLSGFHDPVPLSGDLFSALTALKSLNLYILNRSTLPDDLFSELPTLKGLKLLGNRLTMLPAGIFAGLSSLESLDLEHNPLTTLSPRIFFGLSSLRALNLQYSQLTTLPEGIFAGLEALKTLDLSDSVLFALPAEVFSGLSSLEELNLTSNQLNTLPAGIFAGLETLETLGLGGNGLRTLPAGIFAELSSLERLYLGGNDLTTLPVGVFSGLSSLETLGLGRNDLATLPVGSFSGLLSLIELNLANNHLTTLSAGIFSGLSSLEWLWLNSNDLTTLPAGAFSGLSSLKRLDLVYNHLTTLPAGVFSGLSSLEQLDLSGNDLTTLPAGAFSGLSSLETLDLSGNDLTTLPAGVFSDLSSLETLGLARNDLTTLPVGVFAGLFSLEVLILSRNNLTTLPDGIFSGLSSLESLGLSDNRLTALPARIFSGLSSLESLWLSTNRLTALPEGIFSGLPSLRELSVSDNWRQLTTMISLEFAGEGRFRARADTAALFDVVLPINVVNGVLDGGSSHVNIPRGSVYSATFTVSRNPDPASAVFVDIGELPAMPGSIEADLTLVKSPHLPLNVLEAPSLHFAHFANGESITSELVLVNVGDEPIRPVISFLDRGGNLLSGGWLVEMRDDLEVREDGSLTVRTSIEPLGERTISTHPRRTIVSGSVRLKSDGPLGGVLRYVNPDIGVAGVGASPRVRDAVFPARNQAGGIRTAVAIRNRGAEWMRVRCRLMQAGAVLEETTISLARDGQAARFLDELFTRIDTSNFVGSVRCTAPRGWLFTGVAVEMDVEKRIFTTLPMVPVEPLADESGIGTLVFAHFGNGSSIRSELVLVNVGSDPIRPAVYFYDQQGAQIAAESMVEVMGDWEIQEDGALSVGTEMPALSEITIPTHGRGEPVIGSVRVVSHGPIGGVVRLDVPSVGMAGIGASPPVTAAMFPVRRQENGINTGAAIRNLEAEAMTLACALMQNGRMLTKTEIDLDAGGQIARFIDEMFKEADTSEFAGSVLCTAPPGGSFAGVALEMDADNGIFTTLPVVPVEQ